MCVRLRDSSTFYTSSVTVGPTDREVTVPREAFLKCTVTVTPQTGAGMGPSSTEMLQTDQEGKKHVLDCIWGNLFLVHGHLQGLIQRS